MGKSDPVIFSSYRRLIPEREYKKIAFLGFSSPNGFTKSIPSEEKDFYDLSLNNWNINDDKWDIPTDNYDLIVCTRCPYFSKDPKKFIEKCFSICKKDGIVFLDWGIGDHWRFSEYKVGWVKNGEHEYAYEEDNFLWSFIWDDSFLENSEFKNFEKNVLKHGYTDVKNAIFKEVPIILELKDIADNYFIEYSMINLWEDSPQLYIPLILKKRSEFKNY
tara:strand:- start:1369 stop:2022 length:654 start_codon:yes stop_codon:yes gene_type:complete